jgi:hypothetical protein
MVPAYVAHAQNLAERDPVQALAILRKARRLSPDGPRTTQIDAEIAYLEGKDLAARGIPDPEPFKRALTLDPTHLKARAELEQMEAASSDRTSRTRAAAAAGGAFLLGVIALILFGARRRTPRAAS